MTKLPPLKVYQPSASKYTYRTYTYKILTLRILDFLFYFLYFQQEILDHMGIATRKGVIGEYVGSAIRAFAVSLQNALIL